MVKRVKKTALQEEFKILESQVEELLGLCIELKEENRLLSDVQESHTEERAKLMEKNEIVRSRVEAIITRLKSLSHA
jgi:cell division protein ZapB